MSKFIDAKDPGFTSGAAVGAFKGAVHGLGNGTYHSLKSYWSSSDLKFIMANTPRHFKARYFDKEIEKKKQSDSMLLGSLVHSLLLTPEDFDSEFFLLPKLNLRTDAGKEAKQVLINENPDKTAFVEKDLEVAKKMTAAVLANKSAGKLLLDAHKKEGAFFWTCPFSQLNFKAKLDASSSKALVELKTVDSAHPDIFSKQIYNLNYDLSLIHYSEALKQTMGITPPTYFITVESEAPYIVQCYKVSETMLQIGHGKWLDAVTKLERGIKKKEWTGYFEESDEIPEINPPSWAANKLVKEQTNGF